MKGLHTHFANDFPLMRLKVAAAGSAVAEPLPTAMYYILAVLESWRGGPICFVLPRSGPLAHAAALIYALGRFVRDYPDKVRVHSRLNFMPGRRVKVLPNNKVFLFGGPCEYSPDTIWLAEVNRPTAKVNFPISHVLRLQTTDALRPLGTIAHDVRSVAQTAPLDNILGVKTFGNRSLFSNYVLYLEHQNAFRTFLQGVRLHGDAAAPGMPVLADLLPCGTIAESGQLEKWDDKTPDGEPLVAATSSLANLAAACRRATGGEKVVLANGLGLLSDLQAYDDIATRHRLVLLAQHGEEEAMAALAAREPPCRFWRLDSVLAEADDAPATTCAASGRVLFGPVHTAARNARTLQMEKHGCACPDLERLASGLESLNAGMGDSADDPLRGIARRLFGLLMSSAELVQPPSDDGRARLKNQIQLVLSELDRRGVWLDRRHADTVRDACRDFERLTDQGSVLGEAKGAALRQVLADAGERRTAIIARNHHQADHIRSWAKGQALNATVLVPNDVEEEMFFDELVFPTWVGSGSFTRLHVRHSAPRTVFTGYDFELRWLGQWRSHQSRSVKLPPVDGDARAKLLRLPPEVRIHWPDIEQAAQGTEGTREVDRSTFDIRGFESRVRPTRKGTLISKGGDELISAKYIGFVGNSYAYVTENHELAVVGDLLDAERPTKKSVPMKRVSEVRCSDFVVFREGGEKDVIQTIADRLMGTEAEKTRRLSRLWADELRRSGMTPSEIQAKMHAMGAARCLVTIRSWLNDEGRIGPEQKSDLDLIERVTGSAVLRERRDAVWAAISEVRSQHLSAGMRLSAFLLKKLPDCITAVEDGGSRVNVEDTVSAWIVQVEEIGAAFEEVPRSLVNSLRWEESES